MFCFVFDSGVVLCFLPLFLEQPDLKECFVFVLFFCFCFRNKLQHGLFFLHFLGELYQKESFPKLMELPYQKDCVKCSDLFSFKTVTDIENRSWEKKMDRLTNSFKRWGKQ